MGKKSKIIMGLATAAMIPAMLTGCGHKEHDPKDEWKTNATHHWHECEGKKCDEKLDKAEHEAQGAWLTSETHHWKDCECGYDMGLQEHSYGSDYDYDASQHWKTCECGYTTTKEAHELEHGLCSCGYYVGETLTVNTAKTNINLAEGEKAYFKFVPRLGKHYALTVETTNSFIASEIKYYAIYNNNFRELRDFSYLDTMPSDGYVYIEVTANAAKENAQFCVYETGHSVSVVVEGTDAEKELDLGSYIAGDNVCAEVSLKKGYAYSLVIESDDMPCAEIINIYDSENEVVETTMVDGKLIVDFSNASEDFIGNIHIFINSAESSSVLKVARYCLLDEHTVDTYGHCTSCKAFTGVTESINCWLDVEFESNETKVYRFAIDGNCNYNISFATTGDNAGKTFNYVAYTIYMGVTSGDVESVYEFEEFGTTPSDVFVTGDYLYLIITPNGTDASVRFQVEETL